MRNGCFVLDCEALSLTARRDRTMGARLEAALAAGVRVITSSMTLIEAYHHGRVRREAWQWAMSRIVVEPVTRHMADEAIALPADAGLHGHKYAIDAALAATARRQPGRVVVFTSDEDDMTKLCGPHVLVQPL